MTNPLSSVKEQLKNAFHLLGRDAAQLEGFVPPDRLVEHDLTITLDNGQQAIFKAYRSEHRNTLGPYKGGIRFHPNVSPDEVMALSIWMSLKNSLADLPLGGGKGGIVVDPKTLSLRELEELSRAYARAFADILGPNKDVPAPDVGTTAQIMGWMVDEYSKVTGQPAPATFTGKAIEDGGSLGRDIATSFGGKVVMDEWIERNDLAAPLTVAVQGLGNVGGGFIKLIGNDPRYKLVAASDSTSGVYSPDGIDSELLLGHKAEHGNLQHFSGQPISNEELLLLPVDILVPAALESVIDSQNASNVRAKVILELANGPVSAEADKLLLDKVVIPDILANAGGVVVSYFEWLQNMNDEKWSEQEVLEKLTQKMKSSVQEVYAKSQELPDATLREVAQVVALTRLLQ